jgi:hypothetical protein
VHGITVTASTFTYTVAFEVNQLPVTVSDVPPDCVTDEGLKLVSVGAL